MVLIVEELPSASPASSHLFAIASIISSMAEKEQEIIINTQQLSLSSTDDGEERMAGGGEPDPSGEGYSRLRDHSKVNNDQLPTPHPSDDIESILILFSGPSSTVKRLKTSILARNPRCKVTEYDILNDDILQDLLDKRVQASVISDLIHGKYSRVFIALPCSSYSIVQGQQLRSVEQPRGIEPFPKKWARYINKHNRLTDFVEQIIRLCHQLDVSWAVENPAERSDEQSDAFWEEFKDWGSLWHVPFFRDAPSLLNAKRFLIPLCSQGSEFQKYLQVMFSADLVPVAESIFGNCKCTHAKHAKQAVGLDERGNSNASTTAAYPHIFNDNLAETFVMKAANIKHHKPSKDKTPSAQSASARHLHVGSSKPHTDQASQHMRADRWSKAGSLRCLEPELNEVLQVEPFPSTNLPRSTPVPSLPPTRVPSSASSKPLEMDDDILEIPGPFTTRQLIPEGVVSEVINFTHKCDAALSRAERGKNGWQAARKLRPEPLIFEEHQALNACARGFAWARQDPDSPLTPDSVWVAVLPSSESDPPCAGDSFRINAENFKELAIKEGYDDQEVIAWNASGYPAPELPNAAVIPPPHVGALKEVAAFDAKDKKDQGLGFVSSRQRFPILWPLFCDPCNIVVQQGGPRLVVDKTKWTSQRAHLPSYNFVVDIDAEHRLVGRLQLPTIGQFARAMAILISALVKGDETRVKQAKFDLQAFFRVHPKQRKYARLSGRVMQGGIDIDWRVNFGETDAPLHTCRESDGLCFFIRREFLRLDVEYPCKIKSIKLWLAARKSARQSSLLAQDINSQFLWDVLFFILFYVDDAGVGSFDDLLFNNKSEPRVTLVTKDSGVTERVHIRRIDLLLEAAIGICEYVGHRCPTDKRDGPTAFDMILLGVDVDLEAQRRLLPRVKAMAYQALAKAVRKGRHKLPNGLVSSSYADANSLVHRLLHASDAVALGRQHLFYFRQAIKIAAPTLNKRTLQLTATGSPVIITKAVTKELDWWIEQLEHAHLAGLPLASRYSFPGASFASTLVRYSDASRELDQPIVKSGGGGWCVIGKIFFWIYILWTQKELEENSINVLEAHARDACGDRFLDEALQRGHKITHTIAFVDNSTAEHIAESGRTSTAMLHELNKRRLEGLLQRGVFETNERVTSIDNDVADLISRGDIEEALRFPRDCGLQCVQLKLSSQQRQLPLLSQ